MADEIVRDTKILFDETSIHATDYSLRFFSFRHQATIQAVGMLPGDEITFEVVHLKSGTRDELCGCFITPGDLPTISGVETLLCFACDSSGPDVGAPPNQANEAPYPVRLTANNPVVVLNAPQNVILRAHYSGAGLGTAQVWATLETDVTELVPGQDGCQLHCCVPDPLSWRETGPRRCDLDADKLEGLMIDNCGNVEWQVIDDLNWDDTGSTRCKDHLVQIQQVDQCGDLRWVDTTEECGYLATIKLPCAGYGFKDGEQPPSASVKMADCDGNTLAWVYAAPIEGATTPVTEGCESCGDGSVQGYAVNNSGAEQCCTSVVWRETGEKRCLPIDNVSRKYQVRRQEVNECGEYRWVNETALRTSEETGNIQCPISDADSYTILRELVDICGHTVWATESLTGGRAWQPTGARESSDIDSTGQYSVSEQQVNVCGRMRWVTNTGYLAADTGEVRCGLGNVGSQTYTTEKRVITITGETRWIAGPTLTWQDTGAERTTGVTGAGATYTVERQQSTVCGQTRWITDRTESWQDTGDVRCGPFDATSSYPTQKRQTTIQGETRWIASSTLTWQDTGAERTSALTPAGATYNVERQQRTVCGETRWIADRTEAWQDTGVIKCDPAGAGATYTTTKEQRTIQGETRWVADATLSWVATGAITYGAINTGTKGYTKSVQQTTICGDLRWQVTNLTAEKTCNFCCPLGNSDSYSLQVEYAREDGHTVQVTEAIPVGAAYWTDTGNTRCTAHVVEVEQANLCGRTRWKASAQECGYFATVALPDGGKAFADGQQPPSATVKIEDCDAATLGWVYPTPVEGATTQVSTGCDTCGAGTAVLGYAVNDCCKGA